MLTAFFKRNSLIIMFFAVFALLAGLALIELDKQYYQNEKKQIIQQHTDYYLDRTRGAEGATDPLMTLAQKDLTLQTGDTKEELRRHIWDILNGPGPIYRIQIRSGIRKEGAPQTGAESPLETSILDLEPPIDKRARLNNFRNSLLLRNFTGIVSKVISDNNDRQIGTLMVYYTTPTGDPVMEELTRRYRWYAGFVVVAFFILAGVLARGILLPLRNVTAQLESSTPDRTAFVPAPRAKLELLYNRMALDSVVARLQGQLREEIARRPQMTGWEVVIFVCREFQSQVGAPLVACLELVAEGPGRIRYTGTYTLAGVDRDEPEELIAWLDQAVPRDGRTEMLSVLPDEFGGTEIAFKLLTDPERTGIRYLFALGMGERLGESSQATLSGMLARLSELAEAGLQTLSFRNQLLVQERGRANISLSRNLGHDLTNIIATSKLELMALERLLGAGELPQDDRRRSILGESLQGLLRSVKFMQETVNLYRAYAFLQHPVLEVQDGNKLVAETLELFSISISAKIDVKEELAPDAPRCVVDPRLIKLALFNLFTNALEAIRKTDPDRTAAGFIKVLTRRSRDGGLCIAIEDSGTGIRTPTGEPAAPHEIEKIFELGYTTQRISGSHGEGLGLNWVRTIIHDLHGGSIYAENTETAGARFIILFPPLGQKVPTANATDPDILNSR